MYDFNTTIFFKKLHIYLFIDPDGKYTEKCCDSTSIPELFFQDFFPLENKENKALIFMDL